MDRLNFNNRWREHHARKNDVELRLAIYLKVRLMLPQHSIGQGTNIKSIFCEVREEVSQTWIHGAWLCHRGLLR
jgi:hypothetical protein